MARRKQRLFTIGYEQTPAKAVLDELRRLRPTAPAAVSQTTETMPLVKEMSR